MGRCSQTKVDGLAISGLPWRSPSGVLGGSNVGVRVLPGEPALEGPSIGLFLDEMFAGFELQACSGGSVLLARLRTFPSSETLAKAGLVQSVDRVAESRSIYLDASSLLIFTSHHRPW